MLRFSSLKNITTLISRVLDKVDINFRRRSVRRNNVIYVGLFVLGEANFSDHGANRLGASALMQGLADGYFVIPFTLGGYFAEHRPDGVKNDHPEFEKCLKTASEKFKRLQSIGGKRPLPYFS